MRIVKILSYSVVGVICLGLVACKHNSQQNAGMSGFSSGQSMDNYSAKRYTFNNKSGYTGRNRYGQLINPMVAPSNQTYYFDLDSNEIHHSDYRALALQANYLAANPKAIVRLEGNTDNRGSREYNVALGFRRDQAVRSFLEARGVRPSQIRLVSYGKERPAALGNNEYVWRLNRRVNLVYKEK